MNSSSSSTNSTTIRAARASCANTKSDAPAEMHRRKPRLVAKQCVGIARLQPEDHSDTGAPIVPALHQSERVVRQQKQQCYAHCRAQCSFVVSANVLKHQTPPLWTFMLHVDDKHNNTLCVNAPKRGKTRKTRSHVQPSDTSSFRARWHGERRQ